MPDVPTSVRLPSEIKDLLDEAANKANQSQNDYIITAIKMRLDGSCPVCGRDQAGADYWDRQLSEWCSGLAPQPQGCSPPVVIGAIDPVLGRVAYFGTFRHEWVKAAQITLQVQDSRKAFFVPISRRHVTHFGGPELHEQLLQVGYIDFVALARRGPGR